MNHRLLTSSLLATALIVCLWTTPAAARFIMTDAHFDNRTPGDGLDRRGALFGEPVTGPYDRQSEVVIYQGGGDHAIELGDTQIIGPSEMYWAMRDDHVAAASVLTARLEFTPLAVGNYTIALRGQDQLTDLVAIDVVPNGSSSRYLWRDANSPTGTFFAFAATGVTDELIIRYNLTNGTWTLIRNGSVMVEDEDAGVAAPAVANFVIGHADDGNATGRFTYDMVSLDWRPDDTAPFLLDADFSDKTVGAPLEFRGAFHDEPVGMIGTLSPTVEVGLPMGNKAMVFVDDNDNSSNSVRWQFYNNVEPDDQPVSISFAIAFEGLSTYQVYLRESGSSAQSFLSLAFNSVGDIYLSDAGNLSPVKVGTYTPGVRHGIEIASETALGDYSLWIDDERVAHRQAHGITDHHVGRLIFAHGPDSDTDGVLYVDRIRVQTLGQPLAAPETMPVGSVQLLGAVPNPFNPATEVRFNLDQASPVNLAIFDTRGRLVRRLVDEVLPAGLHRPLWDGRDDAGRQLASGVYHARLESSNAVVTRSLTLLQ